MNQVASRTGKSVKNSTVALSYYAVNLILSFFSRKIFLDYLGTEILGLTTTAQNLLQFLNLAELGISSAVGFTLYKPIHENNRETINEIITLQGHLYRRIAWMILAGGVILMAFFPLIFKKIHLSLWYAYATFGVLLFGALLGYFYNYRQILLTASQKDYKVQYSYRTVMLVKALFQMGAVAWFRNGFVWWLIFELIFSIIGSVSLHFATIKEFPELKNASEPFKKLRKKYSEVVVKIKQLFFHKLGSFVLTQASPLIIYAYTTLTTVALYGNYVTIITGISMMVGSIFNSMGAGVGNLVAEGNKSNIRKVFGELFSLRFLIVSTLAFCVYMLADAFIKIWIGSEYILPGSTLLIICINLFINLHRFTVDAFINAYGLFSDVWSPVIETVINIGCSVWLGYKFGLNGVLSGVMISQILVIMIWKPYYLITRGMKGFMKEFIWMNLIHFGVFLGIGWLCLKFLNIFVIYASGNFIQFFIGALTVAVTFVVASWIALYLVSPGMREISGRIIRLVK